MKRYTEEERQRWVELYLQGKSLTEISRICGCDISTIYQTLKRRGVRFRNELRPVSTKEVLEWLRVYLETGDLKEVLARTDRSEPTVLKHLLRALRAYALRSKQIRSEEGFDSDPSDPSAI
ncbi:hypothetical protein DRO31_04390 [Candidatus Bathyarchaeota archaeon]|nr:MAG: hypothetical protein DRO31_04390 [Candidatus Bathyarchaeota archaeon]